MIIIHIVNICVQLDLYLKEMIRGYVKLMEDGPADGLIVNRSLVIIIAIQGQFKVINLYLDHVWCLERNPKRSHSMYRRR